MLDNTEKRIKTVCKTIEKTQFLCVFFVRNIILIVLLFCAVRVIYVLPKKERQVHIMRNEIRFTLESKQRPKLAQEIGKILETAPHYERVPSCAYDIAGYRLDKEGVLHIPDGAEVERVKYLIWQLRECGFQDDAEFTEEIPMQQDKLTIAVPRASLTDTALENLQKIIANKQALLQRAFQTDSTEVEITEEKINFAWFPYTEDGDEIAAYTQFITRLCDMAKDAKRISSKPTDLDLSEKDIRQQEKFCSEI